MARDPYEVLGVGKAASPDEIKRAYREIAKKSHPDLNPGDAAADHRFKEASQAYAIVGDQEKRTKFDSGEIDATGQERPEEHYYRPHAESAAGGKYRQYEGSGNFEDLGSIFEEMFADAGTRRAGAGYGDHAHAGSYDRRRGADLRYHLDVEFLVAARGEKRRVSMPGGRVLDITIPKGVKDGQTLRLKRHGLPGGDKGEPGDALVTISVRPHDFFERRGDDIHLTLPVTLREAVLGAKVKVPTIDGSVFLSIPENSNSCDILRLKGRGVGKGNQLVTLKVALPERPDETLRQFLRDHPEVAADNPRESMEK